MPPSNKFLCFVLVDKTRRYIWHGPGFRKINPAMDLSTIATWDNKADATAAALALRQALGLEAIVSPLSLR